MYLVTVTVSCDTREQAEAIRSDMEEAAGRRNADLEDASIESQEQYDGVEDALNGRR